MNYEYFVYFLGLCMMIIALSFLIVLIILMKRKNNLRIFIVLMALSGPCLAQEPSLDLPPAIDVLLPEQPITFPEQMPTAAASLQDAIDDLTWRAGVLQFLGNNTTLNETGLFYA